LREVQRGKTIQSAAEALDVSYRTLWNQLKLAEKALGTPLLLSTKGHGSKLSPAAESFLNSVAEMERRFDRVSQDEVRRLSGELSSLINPRPVRWVFCSSSDPLIEQVIDGLTHMDYQTMGSGQALERLLSGDADIAGFHLPDQESLVQVQTHLKSAGMLAYPLMRRTQGLMVSTGNPLRIKKLVDLARPEVRFINRQKGAGTRLLLDTLIEKEGIRSDRIRGYRHEEFTHTAVATAIVAGTADAALGLKYIASQFRLGFVPLEEETFYLAMSPKTHASKPIQKFIQSVQALAAKQVGYRAATTRSRK
jgi:molybdate-binding protein/molybdenum-dependent DNA-binding transcriptional regulator ModE